MQAELLLPDFGTVAECARRYRSYDLFGTKVTPATTEDLLAILAAYIEAGRQCIIASLNMHGMKVMLDEPDFRTLHQLPQTYVHIDGMPVVGLCRLLGINASPRHRVTLVDLIWPMLSHAASQGWRVYFVGSTPVDLATGLGVIRQRIPDLEIGGIASGFDAAYDPQDPLVNETILRALHDFRPHLVLVGMGTGPQERWILRNREAIAPACAFTVGACMMYVSGSAPTAPRWMGRVGLEWLCRLASDPPRYAHRYLVEPWHVLGYIGSRLLQRHS